uniref:hypothetical protein n=1 Tax=Zoogloea sp. TaxID=49181 RepID=UPI0035B2F2C7
HPLNPMDDHELEAKFWRMADRALPREQSRIWLETLWSFAGLDDIRPLMSLYRSLAVPAA